MLTIAILTFHHGDDPSQRASHSIQSILRASY
jgi:hypothetical protein